MKLKVIRTGSAGNCYILKPTTGESLILEAGVNIRDVAKFIAFKWSDIAGVLVTHEHQDHAAHITDFQARGINVYATEGTAQKCGNSNIKTIDNTPEFSLGDFKIRWFDTVHDAAHPVGFLIFHPEMGKLLFVTDTAEIRQNFVGINHLMIEANFDENHPNFNDLTKKWLERVRLSHFSITKARQFAVKQAQTLQTCILIHLSKRHADVKDFETKVKQSLLEVGSGANVYVARNFGIIDLINVEKPNF